MLNYTKYFHFHLFSSSVGRSISFTPKRILHCLIRFFLLKSKVAKYHFKRPTNAIPSLQNFTNYIVLKISAGNWPFLTSVPLTEAAELLNENWIP